MLSRLVAGMDPGLIPVQCHFFYVTDAGVTALSAVFRQVFQKLAGHVENVIEIGEFLALDGAERLSEVLLDRVEESREFFICRQTLHAVVAVAGVRDIRGSGLLLRHAAVAALRLFSVVRHSLFRHSSLHISIPVISP